MRVRRSHQRLLAVLFALLVMVGVVFFGGDWWLRVRVENSLASDVEQRLPGTPVQVRVASFPFLVHLAASGTVLELSVHLTYNGVHLGPMTFDQVDIHVDDLRLSRHRLLHHQVLIQHIDSATVTATISQTSLDRSIGLPITLGDGTVGIGGLSLPARVSVRARQVTVTVPHQISISFAAPPIQIIPCLGQVDVRPGAVLLSCTLHHLPPVVSSTSFNF